MSEEVSTIFGDKELFFELSLDLHCVASPEAKLLHINARWCELLGYSKEKLKAGKFLDLVHPEDVESTLNAMAQLNEGEPIIHFSNRYRKASGEWLWLEWSSILNPGDGLYYASARDITEQKSAMNELNRKNNIFSIITRAQEVYITHGLNRAWWEQMLSEVLAITEGEYGFIGAVEKDEKGEYLRTFAITDISWDEQTRAFFLSGREDGLEFRNLDTLFGKVITTRNHVIANDVESDPRAGGRPPGHPPLNRFLGLALQGESGLVGMLGLANRPTPYDEALIESLSPVVSMLSALIESKSHEVKKRSAVRHAQELQQMHKRILDSTETFIFVTNLNGECIDANRRMLDFVKAASDDPPSLVNPLKMLSKDNAWMEKLCQELKTKPVVREEMDLSCDETISIPCEFTITRLKDEKNILTGLCFVGVELTTRRELIASSLHAATLQHKIEAMRSRQLEDERISTCVEFILNSRSIDESREIIFRSLREIYSNAEVLMFGIEKDAQVLEPLWSTIDSSPNNLLSFDECWASRSRRTHSWWEHSSHLRCSHTSVLSYPLIVCCPLQYHDSMFGVVTIAFQNLPSDSQEDQAHELENLEKRLAEVSQRLSTALATVELRIKLEHAAMTDSLTGICNRRSFEQSVRRSIMRKQRHDLDYAYCIIDIDWFKSVNDSLGHEVGDILLKKIADLLLSQLSTNDTLGRLGGEEFGILLEGYSIEEASQKCEQLRLAIEKQIGVGERNITASFGLIHSSQFGLDIGWKQIYQLADKALYRAKVENRNCVMLANDEDFNDIVFKKVNDFK